MFKNIDYCAMTGEKVVNFKVVVIMANDKLCFVLGAGASAHFGYPLGSELVEAMGVFHYLIQNSKSSAPELKYTGKVFNELSAYNPISIDYFLYNHSNDEELVRNTKRLLEAVISHSQHSYIFEEADYFGKWWKQVDKVRFDAGIEIEDIKNSIEVKPFKRRPNKDDKDYIRYFPAYNWVKFIHHRIVANCKNTNEVIEELKNNIFIITFNYDLSFEHALWRYFKPTKFAADGTLKEYLFKHFFEDRVIHVYGKIQGSYELDKEYSTRSAYSDFETATGEGIEIIGIHKSQNKDLQDKLREAAHIYFLGYGFDSFNNKVLGLSDIYKEKSYPQNISYTNLGNGLICDKAVRGFVSDFNKTLIDDDERMIRAAPARLGRQVILNKSIKNVYEALERDF